MLGLEAAEGAIARVASWGLKELDGAPFFAVTVVSSVGAFSFSKIAEFLGGNTVEVDVADVVGGTLGGVVAGAALGG